MVGVINTLAAQSLGRSEPDAPARLAWQGLWLALGSLVVFYPLIPLAQIVSPDAAADYGGPTTGTTTAQEELRDKKPPTIQGPGKAIVGDWGVGKIVKVYNPINYQARNAGGQYNQPR